MSASSSRSTLDGLLFQGRASYVARSRSVFLLARERREHRDRFEQAVDMLGANLTCSITDLKVGERPIQLTVSGTGLTAEQSRWYSGARKRLPNDIDVGDPVFLAHWASTGRYRIVDGGRREIRIQAIVYAEADVRNFLARLEDQTGIHCVAVSYRGPVITIQHRNVSKLIERMKSAIAPSYLVGIPDDPWVTPKCEMCSKELIEKPAMSRYCDVCKKTVQRQHSIEHRRAHREELNERARQQHERLSVEKWSHLAPELKVRRSHRRIHVGPGEARGRQLPLRI